VSPDEQRFGALFHDAHGDVLRFVQRRLAADEAEDVVSEVFLTAWRRLEDLPARHDDARAWLFGIARGTLANTRRGSGRREALAVRLAEAGGAGTAGARGGTSHEGAELRMDVARAWARLDAADQEVIALCVLDGLTGPQAARVLGTTAVAYRLRLSRARRRLRGLVEGTHEPVRHRAAPRIHAPQTEEMP
jgi:RNA polymerase sigma-70 factor (ECF subfamily)